MSDHNFYGGRWVEHNRMVDQLKELETKNNSLTKQLAQSEKLKQMYKETTHENAARVDDLTKQLADKEEKEVALVEAVRLHDDTHNNWANVRKALAPFIDNKGSGENG